MWTFLKDSGRVYFCKTFAQPERNHLGSPFLTSIFLFWFGQDRQPGQAVDDGELRALESDPQAPGRERRAVTQRCKRRNWTSFSQPSCASRLHLSQKVRLPDPSCCAHEEVSLVTCSGSGGRGMQPILQVGSAKSERGGRWGLQKKGIWLAGADRCCSPHSPLSLVKSDSERAEAGGGESMSLQAAVNPSIPPPRLQRRGRPGLWMMGLGVPREDESRRDQMVFLNWSGFSGSGERSVGAFFRLGEKPLEPTQRPPPHLSLARLQNGRPVAASA